MDQQRNNGSIAVPPLDQMKTIIVDDDGTWHRPEYPEYKLGLAAPKPFLVPSFDEGVVEVLPSEKQNRKINFIEEVSVLEIENRFQLMEADDIDDEDSYEIEIVEGSGAGDSEDDADFYLEMIDGEIFYVFETEDDISVSDEDYESEDSSDSSSSELETPRSGPVTPLQLNIGDLMAPALDETMEPLEPVEVVEYAKEEEKKMSEEVESQLRENEMPEDENTDEAKVIIEGIPDALGAPSSPVRTEKPSVGNDTPPVSPVRSLSGLSSPNTPTTPRSILKACPQSPALSVGSKKKDKKAKKEKKEKKEKTFTKTFVRASDFDGEHRVYSWEKPTWTSKQLKSTGKGDDIRQGANLAGPVTDANKLIESGKVKWEKPEWARGDESELDDLDAKQELIRKIQDGTMNLPGLQNNKRRLKLSINGSILADGGDIVKPITKATIIKKPSDINYVANPKILRATPGGQKLWKGENLAGPVTQATNMKKYEWEKPSWVKAKLHSTGVGDKLKAGQDVAGPITTATTKKEAIEWQNPDWTTKRGVGRAHSETVAIKREYTWEKPSWAKSRLKSTDENSAEQDCTLRPTHKGHLMQQGESLAKPITNLPHMKSASYHDGSETSSNKQAVRRTRSDAY